MCISPRPKFLCKHVMSIAWGDGSVVFAQNSATRGSVIDISSKKERSASELPLDAFIVRPLFAAALSPLASPDILSLIWGIKISSVFLAAFALACFLLLPKPLPYSISFMHTTAEYGVAAFSVNAKKLRLVSDFFSVHFTIFNYQNSELFNISM